jgi:hypothetical protein
MFRAMLGRLVARQIISAVLALGVFLSGAALSWAAQLPPPAKDMKQAGMTMTMPGMAMQDCMTVMGKSTSKQNAPCKSSDSGCAAVCTSCALPVALIDEAMPAPMLRGDGKGVFAYDVNPSDITTPPALPPPILRA